MTFNNNSQDKFYYKDNNKECSKDEVVHIPYNINNILVTEQDIIDILKKCKINIRKINHIEYFIQAFTHKSYCKKEIYPQQMLDDFKNELKCSNLIELLDVSYERLEYLGDRIIKLIVTLYLFHRYPSQDEGFMTKLQTKIEDKKNLAAMSKELNLGKYFIISRQIEYINTRSCDKLHEDIFEAFIAALFLSNGFEICIAFLTYLLETTIDYSTKLYCDNNYKDQLLRYCHQQKWDLPHYVTIGYKGLPHKRQYIIGIKNNNKTDISHEYISYGIGLSKKEGEQQAAKMALIIYNVLLPDQYTNNDIYYPNLENDEYTLF